MVRKSITLAVLSILIVAAGAQQRPGEEIRILRPPSWIGIRRGATMVTPARINPVKVEARRVSMALSLAGILREQVEIRRVRYDRLFVPGMGRASDIGKPELPARTTLIEVPVGAKVRIRIVRSSCLLATA